MLKITYYLQLRKLRKELSTDYTGGDIQLRMLFIEAREKEL